MGDNELNAFFPILQLNHHNLYFQRIALGSWFALPALVRHTGKARSSPQMWSTRTVLEQLIF